MKVILLQDIYKHGVAGEIVDVADGFARNFLIPRGMARKATKGNIKAHQKLMENVEARRAQYENMLNEVARQIDGTVLFFERRAAQTGKLFGSVTSQEMADALDTATGVDINRRRISPQGLRELGVFELSIRLGSEISPKLTAHVVREGQLAEYQAALEAGDEEPVDGEDAGEETIADVEDAATEVIPADLASEIVEAVEETTDNADE